MVTTKINNMKTAMQELIDKLSNSIKFEYRNELVNLLKKEKEQIIDAYENGVGDENERNLSGNFTNAEQYYNQTYNQNK
jgi:hypothetical protein